MPVLDNARVFILVFILFWLASGPDTGPGLIAGPSLVRNRISSQRAAHAVLNSTAWGDFAPALPDDPPETEHRYLNLTGFREEDRFAWEDLPRFKSRCDEWSRNAVGIPETQQPVWQNATGVVRGMWERSNASVSRTHSSYNLTQISPEVTWNGLNSDWSRNVTGREGKMLVRIDDPEDAHTEPEQLDPRLLRADEIRARHVSTTVTIEDIDGTGSSWEMRLHGVHWPKEGAMLFTTSSDKFAGIFGLPHLTTTPKFFESSQALLNRTLGITLDRKERWAFTDPSDPWASTIDAPAEAWNPAPHCEYLLYIQIHPLDHNILQVEPSLTGPQNIINAIHDIEDELRFPHGTPQWSTPQLQMSAVLYSPDCAFFLESKGPPAYPPAEGEHLVGVKQEVFLHNVSIWLLGLALVIFGQVQSLKLQMRETSTPSTLGRVSFYTGSVMLLADGIVFAGSAAWSLSASNTLLPSLVVTCVSFLSMTINIFFLSEIYKVQEPESRRQERERQNPSSAPRSQSAPQVPEPTAPTPDGDPIGRRRAASPPIIIPSDQDIDAEIEEVNNSSTNNATLPAPATAGTPAATTQNNGVPISTIFGRFILLSICILFLSLAAVTWRPSLRSAYYNSIAFIYLSLWTPQIYRNVYRNCRQALSWHFVIGQSVLRLTPIGYFYIWADNFAFAESDWSAFAILVGWVWAQIWVLVGQSVLGPRFGLPKGWLPEAWEYHPVLREDNIEAGGLPIGLVSAPNSPILERVKSADDDKEKRRTNIHVIDCAICREVLEVPVVKAGEEDPTAGGVAGVLARRMYMVTPCRHIFHSACLEGWMRFRLQCPISEHLSQGNMRLINAKTRKLKEFFDDQIPDYAILSHTWGDDEVTFQDIQRWSNRSSWFRRRKRGYTKIDQMCRKAIQAGLDWVWIDTCCIDKSSSAELSEAINSMFDWYAASRKCYVYLEDVPPSSLKEDIAKAFLKCRWLTRGWTLQEYLAPRFLVMLDSSWEEINRDSEPGNYYISRDLMLRYTGIDRSRWREADVPQRLSWAARRQTSRREDLAYCLLGILDVKMPLLYGEGNEAFPRLLGELIKKSNSHEYCPLMPTSPRAFEECTSGFQHVSVRGKSNSPQFSLTNAGLSVELPLVMIDAESQVFLGLLNCQDRFRDHISQVAIVLFYGRAFPALSVPKHFRIHARCENIYITDLHIPRNPWQYTGLIINYINLRNVGFQFGGVYPPCNAEETRQGCIGASFPKNNRSFVLLLKTWKHRTNIVFFVSDTSSCGVQLLVTLTKSESLIHFLLANEHDRGLGSSSGTQSIPQIPQQAWSDHIDLRNVRTWSCWADSVEFHSPESPVTQGGKFRLSALTGGKRNDYSYHYTLETVIESIPR
ncbi:hypothetical protein F4808DRAFT_469900 [Astrocystis sublimbata]|nr:hypothetical protein F4808DRAFT_469900 [Astrocystis sublimbata]